MELYRRTAAPLAALAFLISLVPAVALAQAHDPSRDVKVQQFLNSKRDEWRDWNVPYEDGKVLFDLIVKKNFKHALEIGTSTGHSAVWIAWAMSKTGGRLTTIEIDRRRYEIALNHFEQAGVAKFIDARLADAHELVKTLQGPFDFVFSDADKEWYTRYFQDLDAKLPVGGCFTAHNVLNDFAGIREFLNHVDERKNYRTTIDRTSSSGISISCKTAR